VIPWWSLVLFWPFHLFTRAEIYTKRLLMRAKVPDASEVVPNLYVGGWFADWASSQTSQRWHCIVDLTTEYGERAHSEVYLCAPVWDGNPPAPADIERCARLLVESAAKGPTLCHCASGIGRSATVACAALVKGGHAADLPAALALLQQRRHVVRLNAKMRAALVSWAREFAPGTAVWQDKEKSS
jgi:protein-tyrosine phosphatase